MPGRGGADIGEPLNYSTTIAIPLKYTGWSSRGRFVVPRSAEECRVVPGRGGADIGEPLNYSTTIPSRSMYATFAIVGMLLHFTIEPYDGKNRYLYGFIDGAFYNVCKNRGFYGSRCLVIIYSGNLQGCTRFTHIYRP